MKKKLINLIITPKITVSASIVLFNEDIAILQKTIDCFLKIPQTKKLYLIDNTIDSKFKNLFKGNVITYIENKKNIGFSSGHNKVIPFIKEFSSYHLVLNPDVSFSSKTLIGLISKLSEDESLAMIAPSVKFPNGTKQYTVRKYPSFIDLFARKFNLLKKRIYNQEYRYLDLSKSFFPEAIHGCFMLFKTQDFIGIKGFDERYFLYMEDIDICRKIDAIGKNKLYYPNIEVIHILKKQSSKSLKYFFHHIKSVFKYYLKWHFKVL